MTYVDKKSRQSWDCRNHWIVSATKVWWIPKTIAWSLPCRTLSDPFYNEMGLRKRWDGEFKQQNLESWCLLTCDALVCILFRSWRRSWGETEVCFFVEDIMSHPSPKPSIGVRVSKSTRAEMFAIISMRTTRCSMLETVNIKSMKDSDDCTTMMMMVMMVMMMMMTTMSQYANVGTLWNDSNFNVFWASGLKYNS